MVRDTTTSSPPAGPQRLLVFEQWMETTKWLMERTARFPQRLRASLTARIELAALDVLESLSSAAWSRDPTPALRRAGDALNRLRVLVRLAHELRVISDGQLALPLKERATVVVPVTEGVPWLGFRVYPGAVRLDPATKRRLLRRLRGSAGRARTAAHQEREQAVASSVVEHVRQADTLCLRREALARIAHVACFGALEGAL